MNFLEDETHQKARRLLSAGERLLWAGKPQQGIVLRSSDAFMIPFSLLWGGFSFFWVGAVIASGNWSIAIFGLMFVFTGVYMIAGRFWLDAAARKRSTYAVTDQRVTIESGLFSRTIKSLRLRTLSDVTLNEKADGSGVISFGPTNWMAQWYSGMAWPGVEATPALFLKARAREVYETIRRAQEEDLVRTR